MILKFLKLFFLSMQWEVGLKLQSQTLIHLIIINKLIILALLLISCMTFGNLLFLRLRLLIYNMKYLTCCEEWGVYEQLPRPQPDALEKINKS